MARVLGIQYHIPVPKIWQWNLQIQRAIGTNLVTQLAYVGSHGYNLAFPTDLNQVPENRLSSNDTQYRPYPQYSGIGGSTNNAISNYNSLQAEVQKRMSSGVTFNVSYVWSHFLDDQDSSGWGSRGGPQDWQIANDPSANYSNSNFDVRNAFKGFVVYELPFGKGKRWLSQNSLLGEAVGGWQVSGTLVLMSGNPFTVYGTQSTYAQAGSQFPNWNPGVSWRPKHRSARCEAGSGATIVQTDGTAYNTGCINQWYNPAAFTQPAPGTFGNVRRNSLYGPGINQENLSAGKTFFLPWEGIQFQLRADATNVFNHASFGPPTGTLFGSSGVGQPYTWDQTVQTADGPVTVGTNQINWTTVGGRSVQLLGRITF